MADPTEEFSQLWTAGRTPDLTAFLAAAGPLPTTEVARLVRVDQRHRWQAGAPVRVEKYLRTYPDIRSDPELAIDLIFNEFLLRERLGERPDPADYYARFPEHAAVLKDQVELHRALGADKTAMGDTLSAPGYVARKAHALPEEFGRYRIEELLGEGGMGAVYRAWDTQLERPVALKVPRFPAEDGAPARKRFHREARVAATFHHPNLCPVYDCGQFQGIDYLTMPLLAGEPLSAVLSGRGRLDEATAVRLVRQIAEAMAVAHAAGVVHRDLKPANVIVQENGQPIVLDFGLAKQAAPSHRLTADGVFLGTPSYVAPEQIGADPEKLGPACDVYSLGVILYEALTGRPPFRGSAHEVLKQVLVAPPPAPSSFAPGISPRLEQLCLQALAKDPAARLASMAAFAAALDTVHEPVAEDGSRKSVVRSQKSQVRSQRSESSPLARGWRKWAAVAAALLLIILISGLLAWKPWVKQIRATAGGGAKTVARDPEAAQAHVDRAWELNDRGEVDAAIAECERALALDDRSARALHCQANAFIKKKEFDLALDRLGKAAALDPTNAMPPTERAWIHNEQGHHDAAVKAADLAISLDPTSGEAYYQRGWARRIRGDYRQAVDDFTRAVQLQPRFVWAFRQRAAAYQAVGEHTKAEQDLAKADDLSGLTAGGRWAGRFTFAGMEYVGDVELTLTERTGDAFKGVYATEQGKYAWEVAGTIRGSDIRWDFTKIVREPEPRFLVGNATVAGIHRDGEITAVFEHPVYKNKANLKLRLKK
jgi:serine/threonine protein kinase/Tfp pilus assembly protein PilF